MIFVLIAGSYTPVTVLAMQPAWGIAFLAVIWTIAVAGATLALWGFGALRRVDKFMYIGLGWSIIIAFPVLVHSLTLSELVLMVAGGVIYTLGAIGLALRRRDPRPATFGYHEVWHAMTVAAATCALRARGAPRSHVTRSHPSRDPHPDRVAAPAQHGRVPDAGQTGVRAGRWMCPINSSGPYECTTMIRAAMCWGGKTTVRPGCVVARR